MNFLLKILLTGILFLSLTDLSNAQKKKPVATIFKPVGAVDYKTGEKDWTKAKASTPLIPGDIVRTQENSFAIIKFLENSVLRVQEKSEVTISGEIAKGEFSKNVHLERGEVGFQVKKRPNEKFEFSTPTSVASIRGTGGLLIAGQDSNDVLILGNGIVDFKNLLSNKILNVKGGQTAFSMSNGTIKVEESTPEEKRLLNKGSIESIQSEGNNQEGSKSDTSTSTSTSGITLGLTVNSPIGRQGQNLTVTVEVNQSTISIDSLKKIVGDFALFYRSKSDQLFKTIKGTLSERSAKFSIPAVDVSAPNIQVYTVLTLLDGSQFSSPSSSPETNPISIAVQSVQKNELRVPFTDPNGKRKTMIIEYK